MIKTFRHKGLKRFFEDDDPRRIAPELVERVRTILTYLDVASSIRDLEQPSFRLYPLKGKLKGMWAITVRANWRIAFRFEKGDVSDVDLLDYH
jgi:proteic killer suppression protein